MMGKSLLFYLNGMFKWNSTTQNKNSLHFNVLKWKMSFYAFKSLQIIEGMSDITFNKEGKIVSHLDYWDSLNGLYVKLPFIGILYKISLRMFKVKIN